MAGTVTKIDRTKQMRDMPEDERNELIDSADNVSDLRPFLNQRRRNRNLASFYRQAFAHRPPDGHA